MKTDLTLINDNLEKLINRLDDFMSLIQDTFPIWKVTQTIGGIQDGKDTENNPRI
ncbi:MAG: hypothetical protein KKC03_13310 [Bacteroidetes bacterium]|nr:hypothetical protein [Bacteroidota bacterium]